ncbi:hydroxymethylpyrimidine/phosphomethylpyrimidine kinase / thiaminase [Entomortierella parvispora]|uniref:Hydroxymethylpyrimidine/phosphomethylpyrimidine kinase / thiaminase n=1 Tax=Entomortierella parvispora TaxID=205924 RepID=A0A9P3HFJ0_9FUNG|nr:hydroxymethylpyrimidine/phosphomethylpyrimidine kinase / thiaminase [Entomortierella parvispora]
MPHPPHVPFKVLTIAGSDSGGGAGIQADLKTFTSLETFGTSVLTSITSQNTLKVDGIHAIPAAFVAQQLEAVLSDIGIGAIKTGMLCNAEIINAIGATLRKHYPTATSVPNLVVDPVMIASSGAALLDTSAIESLIQEILPLCFILTPNVPEAEYILSKSSLKEPLFAGKDGKIDSLDQMKAAAQDLARLGPAIVLLKGGHLPFYKSSGKALPQELFHSLDDLTVDMEELELVDLIWDSRSGVFTELRKDFLRTSSTHGTGCTLSAAIASNLSRGYEAHDAIVKGADYVQSAIRDGLTVGAGKGCLNHFHHVVSRSIEKPTRFNPHPLTSYLLKACEKDWKEYTEHEFVRRIGDGTLPKESFIHYMKQDYLFLQTYARAHGLGAFKARTMAESQAFAEIVVHIAHESKLHVDYCAKWGITYEEMVRTPESMANVAYTRYVLDIGMTGDLLDLGLAIAPCLIGYGQIGNRLYNDPNTVRGDANPYWEWIKNYHDSDYQSAVTRGIANLERQGNIQEPSQFRLKQLEEIFRTATRLEVSFWEMALHQL